MTTVWITRADLDRFWGDTFGAHERDVYCDDTDLPDEFWEGDDDRHAYPATYGSLGWQGTTSMPRHIEGLIDVDLVTLVRRWQNAQSAKSTVVVTVPAGALPELAGTVERLGGTIDDATSGPQNASADQTDQPSATPGHLPTHPGSVIWFDGHPYVLDGEPGVVGRRRWVGLDDTGCPVVLTAADVAASANPSPAVIYDAATDRA